MKYVEIMVALVTFPSLVYGLYSIIILKDGAQGFAFIALAYSIYATWRTMTLEHRIDTLIRGKNGTHI